jgi:hypothetical protein
MRNRNPGARTQALFGGEVGVEGFSEVLSREVAPLGIKVIIVAQAIVRLTQNGTLRCDSCSAAMRTPRRRMIVRD